MAAGRDVVRDEEILYRRVLSGTGHYAVVAGVAKPSSQAFSDRRGRPSVDRAEMLGHDPSRTQQAPGNAVLQLIAAEVRAIGDVEQRDHQGRILRRHVLDVEPVPLADNPAHAEIYAMPDIESKGTYRRMLEALARIAEWAIPPVETR